MKALARRALGLADTASHRALDWYINRQWLGWGLLQLWQWHLCNAYERVCLEPAMKAAEL